ncbi:MAG: hypothetical protein WD399_07590 [Thermoleophilaceae bacterium]
MDSSAADARQRTRSSRRSRPAPDQLPSVGARARLRRIVDRYPHFCIDPGATGTITESSNDLICLHMDRHVDGAEDWDNEVCWTPEDGALMEFDEPPTLGDRTRAAFYDDAQIVEPAGPAA